jgi:elongation factor 1-beta
LFSFVPSQADVAVFKSLNPAPTTLHSARWYAHIASYANEFDSLPGDKSKGADAYSPVAASTSKAAPAAAADDDDVDLFGSDDDEVDEEAEKLKAQRVAEYAAKKANKPKTIAKVCQLRRRVVKRLNIMVQSVVTLDVKPWDDETDMKALEEGVRSIVKDGLVWGASKLVPVGYGVSKLQITLVVEDEKISLDELQCVDIASIRQRFRS